MLLTTGKNLSFEQKTYIVMLPLLLVSIVCFQPSDSIPFFAIVLLLLATMIVTFNRPQYRFLLVYLLYGFIAIHSFTSGSMEMLKMELFMLLALMVLYNDWLMVLHNVFAAALNLLIVVAYLSAVHWQNYGTPFTVSFGA